MGIITRTGNLNEDRREQGVAGVGHTQSGIFHPFEYGRSRGRGDACRMKKGNKRFWRACKQIFVSKPFIFLLKNNKF